MSNPSELTNLLTAQEYTNEIAEDN
jgi:hypothetical protein